MIEAEAQKNLKRIKLTPQEKVAAQFMKLEYASVSLGRRKNKIKFFFLFKKTFLLEACDLTAVDHYKLLSFSSI